MCRNIHTLHNFAPPATTDEVQAASLQYVRKIAGMSKPSQANEEAFDRAVAEVAAATQKLLDSLVTSAPPKDREVEAAGPEPRRRLEQRARAEKLTLSQYIRRAHATEALLGALEAARTDLVPVARAKGVYTDEDVFKIVS